MNIPAPVCKGVMHVFYDMSEETLFELTDLFKILGDPTRIKLILLLANREYCVSELADQIGTTHSAISHQLSLLRAKRLLYKRKSGRQIYYTLAKRKIIILIEAGQMILKQKDSESVKH